VREKEWIITKKKLENGKAILIIKESNLNSCFIDEKFDS
jgi:hypothetical protein